MEYVLLLGAFVSGFITGKLLMASQHRQGITSTKQELERLECELKTLQHTQQPKPSLTMWDD